MGRSRGDLLVFIGKRLVILIPVLFGVVTVTFIFTHLAVPHPCNVWAGPRATQVTIQQCIVNNDLDKPVFTQFASYLGKLVTGDFGYSPTSYLPVLPEIAKKFPETLELVLASLVLMVVFGIPLGVIASSNSGRWSDHLVRTLYLSGWATPTYLAAAVLSIAIGPVFGLPRNGMFSTPVPPFPQYLHVSVLDALIALNFPGFVDAIAHLILPATALAFVNMGIAIRMTRGSMLEVLPMDYVKTARMKGLSEFWVLYKHALRNSLISTVTVIGTTMGGILSTLVVIEEVFLWPGLGSYAYDAITNYDFNGTIGAVIFFAIGVVVANLVADIVYGLLDPRVEWR